MLASGEALSCARGGGGERRERRVGVVPPKGGCVGDSVRYYRKVCECVCASVCEQIQCYKWMSIPMTLPPMLRGEDPFLQSQPTSVRHWEQFRIMGKAERMLATSEKLN